MRLSQNDQELLADLYDQKILNVSEEEKSDNKKQETEQ
jgi:hypothetical protein